MKRENITKRTICTQTPVFASCGSNGTASAIEALYFVARDVSFDLFPSGKLGLDFGGVASYYSKKMTSKNRRQIEAAIDLLARDYKETLALLANE